MKVTASGKFTKIRKKVQRNSSVKRLCKERFNDSIEISKKGGPGCRDFWKNLRGNKNCKNDFNCLRIPNTNDITYDKHMSTSLRCNIRASIFAQQLQKLLIGHTFH